MHLCHRELKQGNFSNSLLSIKGHAYLQEIFEDIFVK